MLKTFFRATRIAAIRILTNHRSVLSAELLGNLCVLAPHPDDETMGCGQLLAHQCSLPNSNVKVIVLSDGSGSHDNCCDLDKQTLVSARQRSFRRAMEIIGVKGNNLYFLNFPDGKLHENIPEMLSKIQEILGNDNYTILVPHPLEGWSDHHAATMLGKKLSDISQNRCLQYCVWFYYSMPFRKFFRVKWNTAQTFHDATALEKKRTALKIYHFDKAPCGKPYAGELPKLLWEAVNSPNELYFRA